MFKTIGDPINLFKNLFCFHLTLPVNLSKLISMPSLFTKKIFSLSEAKLLIEDAHVNLENILNLFDNILSKDDYLIVEDSDDKQEIIRDFAFDTKDEFQKIIEATKNADDLILYLRVSISNAHAEIDLSQKFGAHPSEAFG